MIDLNETIKISDLLNPDSAIVKSVLYVYSQETFLPYELNLSIRTQDQSSIDTLGPYGSVLNFII